MPEYDRRPGTSPVVATLLATGLIYPNARVLDIGCGRGPDSLGIAMAIECQVLGIDECPDWIKEARRAARALGLEKRARFRAASLPQDLRKLGEASFDVVIDTMASANIT